MTALNSIQGYWADAAVWVGTHPKAAIVIFIIENLIVIALAVKLF